MMMVVSFVIAVIVGILLALRFKVFVLVPATLLAVAVIVASNYQPKPAIALTVLEARCCFRSATSLVWSFARSYKEGQKRAPAISQNRQVAYVHGNGTGGLKWLRMSQVSKLLALKWHRKRSMRA